MTTKTITLLYIECLGSNEQGRRFRRDFVVPDFADVPYVIGKLSSYDVNSLHEFEDFGSDRTDFIQTIGQPMASDSIKHGGKYSIGRSTIDKQKSFIRKFMSKRFSLMPED